MADDEDEDGFRERKPWPWWVAMGLWGLPGRDWAWGCFWLSILLAIGSVVVGVVFFLPAMLGVMFVFAALWYYAAIRWVDRNGDWP